MKKERIVYIDSMRGLAMFLVVVYHCCVMSFYHSSTLNDLINLAVRMPLFFCISGFFVPNMVAKGFSRSLKLKCVHLLVPTTIMFCLFCWIKQHDFVEAMLRESKWGYWFGYVLFCFFVIYLATEMASRFLRLSTRGRILLHVIVAFVIFELALISGNPSFNNPVFEIFSTIKFFNYPYFVMGAILAKYHKVVFNYLNNSDILGGGNFGVLGLANMRGVIWH